MASVDLDAVIQGLNETGGFKTFRDPLILYAARASEDEVFAFHRRCVEESERFEAEWRDEFESLFMEHADALPEPDGAPPAEWVEDLCQLVDNRDLEGVRAFLKHIDIANWPSEGFEEFDVYPIEAEDDEGWSPLAMAKTFPDPAIYTLLADELRRFKPDEANWNQ